MATPLSADTMLAALRAEGLTVHEHAGWRTHNRAGHGAWGPVHGVLIHHTAGHGDREICYSGRPDLPGPLCHAWLGKTAGLWTIGNGRANHAGLADAHVLSQVTAESYGDRPSIPGAGTVDGNAMYYGLEIENLGTGKDAYPPAQYDQAVRWAAAICRAHGWGAKSVIGHKESTNQKIDPSFDMSAFRAAVAERLKHAATWSPDNREANDMAGMTSKDIAKAVLTTDDVISIPADWDPGNKAWTAATFFVDQGKRLRQLQAQLAGTNTAIGELAKALAAHDQQIDVDALVARIEGAIEQVTVRLDVGAPTP